MDIHETGSTHPLWIHEYTPQSFVIGEQTIDYAVWLDDNTTHRLPENTFPTPLTLEVFQQALDARPELIIIGSGQARQSIPPEILITMQKYGITIDIMTTSSACRTINLLRSEGRQVWGYLWLPESA